MDSINTKIIIKYLTAERVNIITYPYIIIEGKEIQVEENELRQFFNTAEGRKNLQSFLGTEEIHYLTIMTLWGDSPIIKEENNVDIVLTPLDRISTLEQDLTDVQLAIAELYENFTE